MKCCKGYWVVVVSVLLLSGFSENAFSQIKEDTLDIHMFFGGYVFEGNQSWKSDAPVLGIGLGYSFTEKLGVNLSVLNIENELKGMEANTDTFQYRLDGLYHFHLTEKLFPYISAGIGGLRIDPDGRCKRTDFLVNYGGGLKYFLSENIALRADVRHIVVMMDNYDFYKIGEHYNNMVYTVGLDFQVGSRLAAGETGDDTSPSVPPDTDMDGIPDKWDACGGTPVGATVDERGCWIVKNLSFAIGKTKMSWKAREEVDKIIEILRMNPGIKILVEGHTDNTGSETSNQKLSEDRARAIKEHIIKCGIPSTNVSSIGYGEERPIADNDTQDGRMRNRRVEIFVIE